MRGHRRWADELVAARSADVCFGCRSTAQLYLGDVTASDPKCWLNADTSERMLADPRGEACGGCTPRPRPDATRG